MSQQAFPAAAPRLLPLGDSAWTVEFGESISPQLHACVMGLYEALREAQACDPRWASVRDIVPTFRSLTVHFDPQAGQGAWLRETLQAMAGGVRASAPHGRHWRLPVCFDEDLAPDLPRLVERSGLTREAVVGQLTTTEFRVYMIGFMPGFPYMGGLPERLQVPRLATPRKAVPARSLAVAGEMCAVYPWQSPGGWNLVGSTPVPLFVASEGEPSLLGSGDFVQWQAVDREHYRRLESDFLQGRCSRRDFLASAS